MIAAASGLRPLACAASATGLASRSLFDKDSFAAGLAGAGACFGFSGGVFGFTDVAPWAGSTFGVGILEITRSGEPFGADFVGAAFFDAGLAEATAFLAALDDFFTAGFAAFVAAGFAAFFAVGLIAFFATEDFFAVTFFTGDFFADVLFGLATAFFAVTFLVAGLAAAAGFFFFASAVAFDAADLLALDDLAFAVLPAAFFAAGLAVDAFDFGDGRFMVNSSGRRTSLRGAVRSRENHEGTTRVSVCKTSQRMKDAASTCHHDGTSGGPFSSIVLPSGSSRYMDGPSPSAP